MPQELRVVCCYQCKKFQSDIVKKAKKWTCKLCGSNQSLVKEYARGSGKECRLMVQQLSSGAMQEHQLEQIVAEQVLSGEIELPETRNFVEEESKRMVSYESNSRGSDHGGTNRWGIFCAKQEDELEDLFVSTQDQNTSSVSGTCQHKDKFDWKRKNDSISDVPNKLNNSYKVQKGSPLMSFHRMHRIKTKQFKWESRNMSGDTIKSASESDSGVSRDNVKRSVCANFSTINFELPQSTVVTQKASQVESHALENSSSKNESGLSVKLKESLMSFGKGTKWDNFTTQVDVSQVATNEKSNSSTDSLALSINVETVKSDTNNTTQAISKWTKFVTKETEDSD